MKAKSIQKNTTSKELVLILLDIRSVQNTASLFRTADCAGVKKIFLVGTTPSPVDRFKRERKDFAKISLGAEKSVSFEQSNSINELIKQLKNEGCEVVALEQGTSAIDYKKFTIKGKTALILGNEVEGVSKKILAKCDTVIEIPMMGKKESLNVSVAGAIALFRILNI